MSRATSTPSLTSHSAHHGPPRWLCYAQRHGIRDVGIVIKLGPNAVPGTGRAVRSGRCWLGVGSLADRWTRPVPTAERPSWETASRLQQPNHPSGATNSVNESMTAHDHPPGGRHRGPPLHERVRARRDARQKGLRHAAAGQSGPRSPWSRGARGCPAGFALRRACSGSDSGGRTSRRADPEARLQHRRRTGDRALGGRDRDGTPR